MKKDAYTSKTLKKKGNYSIQKARRNVIGSFLSSIRTIFPSFKG